MDQNETANLVVEQPCADHQAAAIPAGSAKKVAIFTNSVSDISPVLAEEFGIHIVPDIILFDTEEYRNNIDIDPPALYQKLTVCEKLPPLRTLTLLFTPNVFGRPQMLLISSAST